MQDNFAEAKKESCQLMIMASKLLRKQVGYHCTSCVKSLAVNLKH